MPLQLKNQQIIYHVHTNLAIERHHGLKEFNN